jgi:ComF family protein
VLAHAFQTVRDGLLGLTYPEKCRVCGDAVESWDDGVACARCWDDPTVTRLFDDNLCRKCGIPVSGPESDLPASLTSEPGRVCGLCSELPFTAARACGRYSGALEASILFLKSNPHLSPRLRALLFGTFAGNRNTLESEIVVPVPLHSARRKQRGFNQADIVAALISRKFNLRLDKHSLVRAKPTERHRAGMDATDRAKSVERAFKVATPRLVAGASVLLVDDVMTTGSTISAATVALIEAGAGNVNVLTIARVGQRMQISGLR